MNNSQTKEQKLIKIYIFRNFRAKIGISGVRMGVSIKHLLVNKTFNMKMTH